VQAEITLRARRAVAKAESLLGPDRFVDMGLRLHVVRHHPKGAEVIPGLAPVASLRHVDFGGVYDRLRKRYVGPSKKPRIWYANERAIELIEHGDKLPNGILAYGGMGSGKTTGILAPWTVVRMLEFAQYAPIEIGGTAPTDPRLEEYVEALKQCMRPDWYRYNEKKHLFTCRNGVRIRLIGTAKRSAAQGSKIQGWNWGACGSDELEDSTDENLNIDARGRRAPKGEYKRLATVTAKDSSAWRELRDELKASKEWKVFHFEGPTNPFVWPIYWKKFASKCSRREYLRVVMGREVPSENALYGDFDREENVQPLPQVGARDITRSITGYDGLLGHDPGVIYDVSILLKAFRVKRQVQWWVIAEYTTKRSTTDRHIRYVKKRLQKDHRLQLKGDDEPKVLVRCDPQGDSDNSTDRSVYIAWRQEGFMVKSAAYTKKGQPQGRVPRDAGDDMLNGLWCAADEKTRSLYIACKENGKPCAPRLAAACEDIDATEPPKKGIHDQTHWPKAAIYALWPYEKKRSQQGIRTGRALV
jgi:hypothetical protein